MSSENLKGFFQQLRHLSAEITSNTAELKARLEVPAREDFSSKAVLKLQEIRKDVKTVKIEAQDKLQKCQKETADFGELVTAVRQYVEYQRKEAQQLEDYMKQYGFITWAAKNEADAKEESKKEEETIRPDECTADESVTLKTPQSKPPERRKGTPKLEDFGLSEYTLQARSQYTAAKTTVNPQQVTTSSQSVRETVQRVALTEQPIHAPVWPTPVTIDNNTAAKKEAEAEERPKKEEETIRSDECTAHESVPVKTPQSKPPERRKGTPKLEDFGLSEYTLQARSQYTAAKTTVNPQQVTTSSQSVRETVQRVALTEQPVHAPALPTTVITNNTATPLHPKRTRAMCATPDLKDFGLSEMTMQSLNLMKYQSEIVSETPHAVQLEKLKYGCATPDVPAIFKNNGLVVTPSLVTDHTLPLDTPSYHVGGVKGFEAKDKDKQVQKEPVQLKLEDYLDTTEPPVRSSLNQPPKLTLLSSRLPPSRVDKHTPPEPEFLSFRLQMLQKASESGNLEMSTPDRFAAYTTGNVGKSASSGLPLRPRLKGRYHFGQITEDSENIPPSSGC